MKRVRHPYQYQPSEADIHRFRLSILLAVLIILSFILILRLAYLQINQFNRYETLSLKNQMSIIPIPPPRGIILDKNGVVLADNLPVYSLEITPEHIKNLPDTIERLKDLIPSISDDDVENFQRLRKQNRAYVSLPIKLKLSQEDVAVFASNQYQFPGVSIKARLMRYYPLGEIAAHVIGYVGRINIDELKQVDAINYRGSNFIGKAGIEKFYENELHGLVGYQQVETDVSGRTLRTLSKQAPLSGSKLYLTLDIRLQQAAYEALKGNRGALAMIDVKNGGVLAMASAPSFDPNLFVNGISNKDYKILSDAIERPLYNRAVRGLYPPASTVKPFVALAGLEKGVIDINSHVYDPGWYRLPNVTHKYRDWKRTGHGVINVIRAITVSCDTFFYQLGNKMGISSIEDMLVQFGYGQLTHIDLNEEAPGLVPNPRWKRATKGVSWYPGDTLITAIGQGFMLASPLQIANATAALSTKGHRYRPHLLAKMIQDGGKIVEYKPLEEYPVKLKNEHNWNIVIEGMRSVIRSNEGTGLRFGRNPSYDVAGKTGTAQVFSGNQYEKKNYESIPVLLRDHTLFIAFAPIEEPEVALAVIVENNFVASFVARAMMDKYFELKKLDSNSITEGEAKKNHE